MVRSSGIKSVESGDRKLKNLLNTKNIKTFAKLRKRAKAISNRTFKTEFPIPKTRIAFIQLRKAFIEISILCNFNFKCHI